MADKSQIDGLSLPENNTATPFALFLNDGEMQLFWAANLVEFAKWKNVFEKLIP